MEAWLELLVSEAARGGDLALLGVLMALDFGLHDARVLVESLIALQWHDRLMKATIIARRFVRNPVQDG